MEFNIGDRIQYIHENNDGSRLKAEVVDIWKNSTDRVIGYFASLDSGEYVHIQPDSGKWNKVN